MHPFPPIASAACLALLATGCAQVPTNVVFMTKASIGIDVEATAQTASFAYDRVEGYFAPRYPHQAPPPVFASLDTNGQMIDREIKQKYATGQAAILLSQPLAAAPPATLRKALFRNTALESVERAPTTPQPGSAAPAPKAMFFGTGTVLGFKLGFGPTSIDNFTLGFKRKELSIIPHDEHDGSFPSVLASFDSTVAAKSLTGSTLGISQFFATGDAADALAGNRRIHDQFEDQAVTKLSEYRDDERHQRRYALLSLSCLSELNDAQAAGAWLNAGTLGLFPPDAIKQIQGAPTGAAARKYYTQEMVRIDPDSKTHTGLMQRHQVHVCDLRSKT